MNRTRLFVAALLSVVAPAASARAQNQGETQFLSSCAACHQANGLGIKGAFPALAGSAVALGDPAALAALVLNGRGGMPTFGADLTDAQIASALTYVRSAFGNAAAPVTEAEVSAARARSDAPAAQGLQAH